MGGGFPIKAFGNDTCPHGSGEPCPRENGERGNVKIFLLRS